MNKLNLKPSHKPVKGYYTALEQFHKLDISNKSAVRGAFQSLLDVCGRQFQWKLAPEWQIRRPGGNIIRVDGALVDTFKLIHGFWEAKDTQDTGHERRDDEQYIVRLIGQIITVSLKTVEIVGSLPELGVPR